MEAATKILLPIILILLGAVVGMLSSVLTSAREQRQGVSMKLLDQYLEVRKDVVQAVSDLTNLGTLHEMSHVTRTEYRDRVSKLFYMHYDSLPKPVLDALILLHVALDRPEQGPYGIVDDTILPMPESQLSAFVQSCSFFRNATFSAPLALNSRNPVVRSNQVIKLHARSVLTTLNQFSSVDDLLELAKKLKKVAKA
jgi:hypothetical protein